jgi:glycosyltransferase involved in cell wall biosynthesis
MRVLTVTHFYESHGGGIERVAGHLNRAFADLGAAPAWAAADLDPAPADARIAAVPLKVVNAIERLTGLPMPVPMPGALAALARAVAAADAVVIHDGLYATSVAAMIAARRARKPTVLVQHIAAIPFANPALRAAMAVANRLVTRPMLGAADRVVFISATTRAAFAHARTRAAPLTVHNGVDTAVFHPGPADPALRAAMGAGAGRRLVLFVGRFVEKKGMRVLATLARARPDLAFVLAGRGPVRPEAWEAPNVTVVRDRSGPSLAELYRAADVLVLPSVGEGYPLVVQEAMACGLPVVCGLDSAHADPDATAWLVGVPIDHGRADETAARVAAALDAPQMESETRAAMAAYARQAYSWTGMARRILDELDRARRR